MNAMVLQSNETGVVPAKWIPHEIHSLRRSRQSSKSLSQYLIENQNLHQLQGAHLVNQLTVSFARNPQSYLSEPLDIQYDAEIFRFVQLWPEGYTRPLAEISVICNEGEYLHLFNIAVTKHGGRFQEKKELLMKAALFFYINFGVESEGHAILSYRDNLVHEGVSVTYPREYKNKFNGTF